MCLKVQYHTNPIRHFRALVAQTVKNLLAVQEMWVQPLGWEAPPPPERRMATHCSILAWEIPGTRGAWRATIHMVKKEVDST